MDKKVISNFQKKIISDFQKMIDVNTPIIYINDYDFVRVDEIIKEIAGNSKVFEWNPATGTTDFKRRFSQGKGDSESLKSFLLNHYTQDPNMKEKFLVLRDIQGSDRESVLGSIEEPAIKTLLQLIAQRKLPTPSQPQPQPQPQAQPQITCNFDGTGYVTEQRSTFVEQYNVGSKIKNFDGFGHNHIEGYPDNNTQTIAWVQGNTLYGMYIHVDDNQNYIDEKTQHSYMTMISKTHEVITTVQAKALGLYDGSDFKLMDCYIVHMKLDHTSDED